MEEHIYMKLFEYLDSLSNEDRELTMLYLHSVVFGMKLRKQPKPTKKQRQMLSDVILDAFIKHMNYSRIVDHVIGESSK